MRKVNIQLVRSNFIWFEVYYPNHPEVIKSDYDGINPMMDFCGNFDYESLPADFRHVYIDIEMKMMPMGGIMVRSDFEFESKEFSCDDIFTVGFIHPMVRLSILESITAFEEQCEAFRINLPYKIPLSEEVASSICEEIVDHYIDYRKPHDIVNDYLMSSAGLECRQSNATIVIIKGTFLIIDQLIYTNPQFDRKHNLKALINFVPEQKYITIRMNCMEIVKHPVKLSLYDSILFYTCVDCALQILLSDKSDLLIPTLEANGMTKPVRDAFFRYGTEFFNHLRKTALNADESITNLDEKQDWNKLLR